MEFTPGDRVELVATNDPYTHLRPGDRGTVTSVTDLPEPTIGIQWDNGSTLAILPDAGDLVRPLPTDADPPPSTPPSAPPPRAASTAPTATTTATPPTKAASCSTRSRVSSTAIPTPPAAT